MNTVLVKVTVKVTAKVTAKETANELKKISSSGCHEDEVRYYFYYRSIK